MLVLESDVKQGAAKAGKTAGGMTCEMAQRAMALEAMTGADLDGDPGENPGVDSGFNPSLNSGVHPSPSGWLDRQQEAGAERYSHRPEPGNAQGQTGSESALAEHLRGCRSCQAEMAATTAFFRTLASEGGPDPSPTLLARARMQLDASLDSSECAGFAERFAQYIRFTAGRLRAAPGLSSALLFAGLLAGGYGGYQAGHAAHAEEQTTLLLAPPAPETPSVVADVSSVRQDPETGMVEVHYDRLVPDVLSGPANEPSIRELLMAAAENGTDTEVRHLSVGLLGGPCAPGALCRAADPQGEGSARNALLGALATDKAAAVRREALAGLQPFLVNDLEVRDAVLQVLMSDPSASVRMEAVRALQSVGVDSSVRQVLHTAASHDGDPSIRRASTAALKAVPQVQ